MALRPEADEAARQRACRYLQVFRLRESKFAGGVVWALPDGLRKPVEIRQGKRAAAGIEQRALGAVDARSDDPGAVHETAHVVRQRGGRVSSLQARGLAGPDGRDEIPGGSQVNL